MIQKLIEEEEEEKRKSTVQTVKSSHKASVPKPPPVDVECLREPFDVRNKNEIQDFAIENASDSIAKIHANVVSIFSNDKDDVIRRDAVDDKYLTSSTRSSVSGPRPEFLKKGIADTMKQAHVGESNSSIKSNDSVLSATSEGGTPFKSVSKKAKVAVMNLESARHEAMMDEDLKPDFKIVRRFLKAAKASIDIRNRRRRASTYLNCFSGSELVKFLVMHGVASNSAEAEVCAQRLLEVGFIDRSMPPPPKSAKKEIRENERDASEREKSPEPGRKSPTVRFAEGAAPIAPPSLNSDTSTEVDDLIDGILDTQRTRGATMLATMWEGDYMFFATDLGRLYTIGDVSPSVINLMSSTSAQKQRSMMRKQTALDDKRKELLTNEYSLLVLSRRNTWRLKCVDILCSKSFDNIILFLIAFSSVLLALDEPSVALNQDAFLYKFLFYCDYILTTLFVGEMLIKIFAMGFGHGSGSYMKNSWNVLDFCIVMVSVVGIAMAGKVDLSFLKSLRAMRGLRPLRMVSRAPGMKMVVNAIFIALPACINVVLVVGMCFLVFAIVGQTFFGGLFYYCAGDGEIDKYSLDRDECIGTFTDDGGNAVDREWVNYPSNFDNVAVAMTTLFEVASLEMWPEIMAMARDVTEVDKHPVRDAAFGYSFFFVLFIFIGSFFVINLFVGVVINKFSQVKAEGDGNSLFMSKEAQEWIRAQKAIMGSTVPFKFKAPMELEIIARDAVISLLDEEYANIQETGGTPDESRSFGTHPDGPYNPSLLTRFREFIFHTVDTDTFDNVIMTVIMISIITMAMPYLGEAAWYTLALAWVDFAWNGIFISEMVLKNIGLGPRQYFQTNWNRFDFVIVIISIFDMAASGSIDIGIDVKILRVMRVARMLRLVRHNKPLLNLFMALFTSLPSLGNVGSILLLCLYVYAVMGMNLFSDVTIENYPNYEFINERTNFGTFGYSMLTLFRSATGESWNGVMHEIVHAGYPVAAPFFVSFVVICTFIMLNLFIAVILENFSDAQAIDKKDFNSDHIEQFTSAWSKLDLEMDYYLEGFKLVGLLYDIEAPLGLKGRENEVTRFNHELNNPEKLHVVQYIRELNIKRDKYGLVFFLDVLGALVAKNFGLKGVDIANMDASSFDMINKQLMSNMAGSLKQKFSNMDQTQIMCDLSDEFNSASAIQCAYRGKMERRRFYNSLVEQGLWSDRMQHLYAVTLKVWTDEVHLGHEADAHVKKKAMSDEEINEAELHAILLEIDDTEVAAKAPEEAREALAPPLKEPKRSSILSFFGLDSDEATKSHDEELGDMLSEAEEVLKRASPETK
jgi:hypothetical protein